MTDDAKPDDTGAIITLRDSTTYLWPLTPEVLMGLDAYRQGLTCSKICDQWRMRLITLADGTISACIERNTPIAKD